MKKRLPSINNLKRLIGKCLDEGFHLAFYLPNQDLRNPTWDELQEYATESYSLALQDVLAAINGNTESLEKALSEDGRLFIREDDRDRLLERLEEVGTRRLELLAGSKNDE
ncbi:MAG: hypothetical protein ACLP5H_07245 [Desulfomonilaceae bacterium]